MMRKTDKRAEEKSEKMTGGFIVKVAGRVKLSAIALLTSLALFGCGTEYPQSLIVRNTEFNAELSSITSEKEEQLADYIKNNPPEGNKQDTAAKTEAVENAKEEASSNAASKYEAALAQMTKIPLPTPESFKVPADSTVYDPSFASLMLILCAGHNAENTAKLYTAAGMEVLTQVNYDKDKQSPEHTSAYTVGHRKAEVAGTEREVIVVTIRGTDGGEWYSNFDFAPSHSAETEYAENFLLAATDILAGITPYISEAESPVVVVTGHSRGAACANLLGTMLDGMLPVSDVYVYTSATPTTVRGKAAEAEYPNIFNLINTCDVVPLMPLKEWGYKRAGTDIVVGSETEKGKETAARVENSIASLLSLAPTIPSYYEDRHSLEGAGLSKNGMTTFEAMLMIAKSFTDMSAGGDAQELDTSMLENSDFSALFDLFNTAEENGSILTEHLNAKYLELLKNYATAQAFAAAQQSGAEADWVLGTLPDIMGTVLDGESVGTVLGGETVGTVLEGLSADELETLAGLSPDAFTGLLPDTLGNLSPDVFEGLQEDLQVKNGD